MVDELEEFLGRWKRDIGAGDRSARKRSPTEQRSRSPSPESQASEDSGYDQLKRHAAAFKDPPPLLVLPAAGGKGKGLNLKRVEGKREKLKDDEKGDLVRQLISDLDEVNMIPFFEVQLPREIALLIFSYLTMRDLCNCGLVSRNWRSLAEDDLLWCRHYKRLLKPTHNRSEVKLEWKLAVQDLICRKQQVERNWKERICGLSDYQPDDCRVLCCLSYSQKNVLSCYSSGDLCVWDLANENGPARVKQIRDCSSISEPSCCDLDFPWGAVGTSNGYLKVVDVQTCQQLLSFSDLGNINCVGVAHMDKYPAVGVAYEPTSLHSRPSLAVFVPDGSGEWERTHVPLGDIPPQTFTKVKLLSLSRSVSPSLLYSTSTSLTLHPLHSTPMHILNSVGVATHISCFECDPEMRSVACGTTAFGYWVQLFDLSSGVHKTSLKGHGQHVTSLAFDVGDPHMIVSGSVDKRVRIFDSRCHSCFPLIALRGHTGVVRSVQMHQWKVVSGSTDGSLIVWDKRMNRELWNTHERHAVEVCCLDDPYLICGHVPTDKNPIRFNDGENPNICHRRLRGLVRVMDFSVDPLFYTKKLPSICSSAYDEPIASSFNLDLIIPYDDAP